MKSLVYWKRPFYYFFLIIGNLYEKRFNGKIGK